jgi:hypothetical protein
MNTRAAFACATMNSAIAPLHAAPRAIFARDMHDWRAVYACAIAVSHAERRVASIRMTH